MPALPSETTWYTVRVTTGDADAVIATLFTAGALGVHEERDAVVTHFPSGEAARAARAAVQEADPAALVELRETPPQDWSEWRGSVRAWTVGSLTVAPPWLAAGLDRERTVIIDPAMAFGTGEHATTRGVLRLMQDVVRPGDTVVDLGAGSGVLAIAAAKLGAGRSMAIEHDPDAVSNAEANVRANGVENVVSVLTGDAATLLPLVAPVRVVVANIASLALLQLLPRIHAALLPGGCAILSGILESESSAFREAFSQWPAANRQRPIITAEHVEDDWWTAAIELR